MPNEFAETPVLDKVFPRTITSWNCPTTCLEVPKDPEANLKWRADILELAEEDIELQTDLYTACSQSILFFVNAFVFTLRVFEPGEAGAAKQAKNKHLPMVTWEIQDTHILRIEECIDEGQSLLTDKTRDMGATWNHVVAYVHRLLFRDSESHLMLSRKEDTVDLLDGLPKNYPHGPIADPGTLFGKIDYVLSRLPEWMLPNMNRKKMHLVNLDNGTRIDGESSNATAGSSDRRTSIFLDEMAKMKEGESIKRSTRDVTACRLVCSTPNGPGTAYSKWRMSGQIPVFILPWWEHPEKGKDRYVVKNELGRFQIRSPWYDHELTVRSPKEMAIEIDMDHVGSGDTFFEGVIIEQHRLMFASAPRRMVQVNFRPNIPDTAIPSLIATRQHKKVYVAPQRSSAKNHMKVWCPLPGNRPDQDKTYVVGADISKGMGASNSTISVYCNETKEKIMSLADANISPSAFAKLACAVCLWVGGRHLPLLIWENNGDPGFDFGRQVTQVYCYPNIYFDRMPGTLARKRGKRYGWRSSAESKAVALGMLRRAYAHGGIINHDELALDEALTYVQYENGGIGPAELVEESVQARKTHGDRVIADMLCLVGAEDAPKRRPSDMPAPKNSFKARFNAWKKKKKNGRKNNRDRFDFN